MQSVAQHVDPGPCKAELSCCAGVSFISLFLIITFPRISRHHGQTLTLSGTRSHTQWHRNSTDILILSCVMLCIIRKRTLRRVYILFDTSLCFIYYASVWTIDPRNRSFTHAPATRESPLFTMVSDAPRPTGSLKPSALWTSSTLVLGKADKSTFNGDAAIEDRHLGNSTAMQLSLIDS